MVNTQLDFSSTYHPQIDGQMEVVNRALGDLLRCLTGEHVKSWDQRLCQAEFSHYQEGARDSVIFKWFIPLCLMNHLI